MDLLVDDIAEKGWSVQENFLPEPAFFQLREELISGYEEGVFHKAGIGRADGLQVRSEIRSDYIHWLEEGRLTPAQQVYWDKIMELKAMLNRSLFLSLNNFECHFAVFPAGSFYKKHIDQFKGVERRIISCVLYLNKGWQPEDEGWLRIYDPLTGQAVQDVPPLPNTLVVFRSADVLHEVLPTQVKRYSITGWLRNDEMPFLG